MRNRFNLKVLLSCLVSLAVVLSCSSIAFAVKGPQGVSNGFHNLSSSAIIRLVPFPIPTEYASTEDEICVFCHTPHGGRNDAPLWNRSNPESTWTHYNSATLSSEIKTLGASRNVEQESLLCMSCHDGSISVYHVLNLPNDRAGALVDNDMVPGKTDLKIQSLSALTGATPADPVAVGDLSDDHPISFSYSAVEGSISYQSGAKAGQLHDVATATGKGVRFFGASDRVECSSCHDPHVNYNPYFGMGGDPSYTPFLITTNNGSQLCLACHNK